MEPRFLADSMLGKLARWLVLLGYDVRFAGVDGRSDLELLEQAHREGRVFLTRDRKIPSVRNLRMVLVREQHLEAQLLRVLSEMGLKPDRKRIFTRCTCCNELLSPLTREEALPLVPPLVKTLETPFFRCPTCRRVYWNGTHTERTEKRLEKLGVWRL
ncbi:MAG: Mut7-C RNAse domain-containing protein [Elusimicrobiota bacterium]